MYLSQRSIDSNVLQDDASGGIIDRWSGIIRSYPYIDGYDDYIPYHGINGTRRQITNETPLWQYGSRWIRKQLVVWRTEELNMSISRWVTYKN